MLVVVTKDWYAHHIICLTAFFASEGNCNPRQPVHCGCAGTIKGIIILHKKGLYDQRTHTLQVPGSLKKIIICHNYLILWSYQF